ncbi:MAG TPA: RidA family protein [Solirubrobacter sp.]|jgi:enamine deaminase RidA (YjgF/YER057c/UK114 family)|nr:RidA family protein [Solirubrobacter sp.]
MKFATPDDLPATHGYSHVVTVPAGTQVWVAGQVGNGADGVAPEGIEAQARLAFENVGRALAAAGASWNDVFKMNVYVTDIAFVPTVRAVRDEFVNHDARPVSTLVAVTALVRPELLIEIEVGAAI